MAKEPDWDDFPNFSRSEMACRHTNKAYMCPDFMDKLQSLRDAYGKPLRITSAYRDETHPIEANKPEGRLRPHTTGRAADVAIQGHEAYALMRLAMKMGFLGIGVNQKGDKRFLHLDTLEAKDGFPRPWVWSY
jgi:zinc D-Ala-D-Ala carboxypeptidase